MARVRKRTRDMLATLPDLMVEGGFKAIPGLPGYAINDQGRIIRIRPIAGHLVGQTLIPRLGKNGYLQLSMSLDGKRVYVTVHSLVAITFLGPKPSEKHEVAHNDGNRLNCNAINLRWDTRSNNHMDRWKHGTMKAGSACNLAKLKEQQVRNIRAMHASGEDVDDLAILFEVSKDTIRKIVRRVNWAWLVDY